MWGNPDVLDTTLVHPALAAEASADRVSTTAASSGTRSGSSGCAWT
ncbi:hypothetical protein ABZY44_29575 [Streptomyces sp. NPDC006544]